MMAENPNILLIGIAGNIVAIDAATGKEIWRNPVGGTDVVVWHVDGDVVYAAAGSSVVCLNQSTGIKLWSQYISWWSQLTTLHFRNGNLYVGSGGVLYCLNPISGELIWHNPLRFLGRGILMFDSNPTVATEWNRQETVG